MQTINHKTSNNRSVRQHLLLRLKALTKKSQKTPTTNSATTSQGYVEKVNKQTLSDSEELQKIHETMTINNCSSDSKKQNEIPCTTVAKK